MRTSHITRNLLTAIAALAAAVAVGCGGGDSSDSPSPPPPVNGGAGNGSGVVGESTEGRLGPAGKVTAGGKEEILERSGKIRADANKPTNAQKNGVAGAADCTDAETTPTPDNLAAMAASVLCLVNAERTGQGLAAVTQNGQLDQAAQGMANEMVEKVFFSHETPDGRNLVDRVQPTGWIPRSDDWVLGENLAWGSGALSTPRAIVNGWMNSEGHKANILDGSYKEVGLGTKMGSPSPSAKGGTVFVHNFGAKSAGAAAATADDSGSGGDAGAGDDASGGDQSVAGSTARARKNRAAVRRCKARARKVRSASKRRKAVRRCARLARRR